MTDLIINIFTWLISSHSITLKGWQWLFFFPISTALFMVVVFFISHVIVRTAFHR